MCGGSRLPRVLIADDNHTVRKALVGIFAESSWTVCGEATNGVEAVELAAKLKPDVILLDFQMPQMNGLDAAKAIIKRDPTARVAMYTLHQNQFFETQAKSIGVRAVISKSDVFSALLPSLQAIIE